MKRLLAILLTLTLLLSFAVPFSVSAETAASSRVETILSNMTLRQKVTQMLMVDFRKWGSADFTVMNSDVRTIIENYDFGSVIYFANNLSATEQSYNLTMEIQTAATKDGGLPLIICADQEGGSVYRLGTGTALPGNMALGAAYDTAYAEMAGQIIGRELAALGINTTLAPVVDVNSNPNNPVIGLRSYSDNASLVGTLASANIKGLSKNNVIGCAKHFPGHGDTATDSHYGLPLVDKSLSVLRECELKPYEIAIEQGIDMIMTAHILYPQLEKDKKYSNKTGANESLPATMSDDIVTGLLKEDMGFDGIVVTDAMNMAGISNKWDQVQSVVIAIQAGVDMICMPCTLDDTSDLTALDAIIDGVITAVGNGTIPTSRIDDAVRRILTVKEKRGILDWSADDFSADYADYTVGSDLNRQAEREIAAAAVTVVQNKNNTLPLNVTSSAKVLVFVPNENEQAQIAMAWNRAKQAGVVPSSATLEVVNFNSSSTVSTANKTKIKNANIVIAISEVSTAARMNGENWRSAFPIAAVTYAEQQGKITAVMSADKPYDVQSYTSADAVISVYGCKGSSVDVTEALVGGATGSVSAYGPNLIAGMEVMLGVFGASGKLPLDIPKFISSSSGYDTSSVLYSRGFGITYSAKHTHSLALVSARDAVGHEGYTQDFYECSGCGMWFEDSNAQNVITNKFSITTDMDLDVDLDIVDSGSFWLTHYNSANEGTGSVHTTHAATSNDWNNYYAFEPVLGTEAYRLTAISVGIGTGAASMPQIPANGFVYGINYGNDYPALYASDPVNYSWCAGLPDYTSDSCDNMISAVLGWKVGDMFTFKGLDLTGLTVPTSTSGTNWYDDSYVCTATYRRVAVDTTPDAPAVDADGDGIPDSYGATVDASGNYTFDNAYGHVFDVDYVNGKIVGEDISIITDSAKFASCNPKWATNVVLAPTDNPNEYSVQQIYVCRGTVPEVEWSDGTIVLIVHSDGDSPSDGCDNWMNKIAARALNIGDTVTVSGDKTMVTVQDAPLPELKFNGASLSLYSNITINFKADEALFADSKYENPYAVFVLNGETTVVTDYTVLNGRYVFDFANIAPHQLNDTVTATLYATADGVEYVSEAVTYSVSEYCYNMLAKCTDDAQEPLRTLIVDLLNYGSDSQTYMSYNVENPANASLTEQQRSWATSEERTLDNMLEREYNTIENPTVAWKGAGLNLNNSVGMRFKFDASDVEGLAVKVSDGSQEWQITSDEFLPSEDGYYYAFFEDFNAGRMSDCVYVTVYKQGVAVSNTLRYSIESYAYTYQDSTYLNLADLVRSMIKYGDSAKTYYDTIKEVI